MRIKEFLSSYLQRNTNFTPDTIRRMVELMEDADRTVMSFDGALIERMNADIYEYPREMEQLLANRMIMFLQSLTREDSSDLPSGQITINIEVEKLIHDDELAKRLIKEGYDEWFSRLALTKTVLLRNSRHGYHVLLNNKAYTISFNSYFDPSKITPGEQIAGYIENHNSFCILDVEPDNRKKSIIRRPPHFCDKSEPVQLVFVDSVNIHADMKISVLDDEPIICISRKDDTDTTVAELVIDINRTFILPQLEQVKDLDESLLDFIKGLDDDKAQNVCKTIRRIAAYLSLLYNEVYEDLNEMYEFLELRRHPF